MALTGTLKDFGIAEILQLIGQQAKSGVLHLKSKDDVIHIAMSEGSVVKAESAGRKATERLGNLLVRAELITPEELDRALEEQKRTLRRLGDVLVGMGLVSPADVREMTALQTTETVYKLFRWKSGTYAFEPGAVEYERASVTPLRAESVLMEGFRQVDEWPVIRRKITSPGMTFERLRELPPDTGPTGRDEVDAALDAFGEKGEKQEFASLGPNERKIFALAAPGRPVSKVIDLSRLGEFEASKALLNLVNVGILRPIAGSKGTAPERGTFTPLGVAQRIRQGAARLLGTLAIAAALAVLVYSMTERAFGRDDQSRTRFRDQSAERYLARYQRARLSGALEIYRLERGEYPSALSALVEAGIVTQRDLRYPWLQNYYYRVSGSGFVLLNPIE